MLDELNLQFLKILIVLSSKGIIICCVVNRNSNSVNIWNIAMVYQIY